MSISVNKPHHHSRPTNILISGYLREYENKQINTIIPELVQHVLFLYSQEYIIHSLYSKPHQPILYPPFKKSQQPLQYQFNHIYKTLLNELQTSISSIIKSDSIDSLDSIDSNSQFINIKSGSMALQVTITDNIIYTISDTIIDIKCSASHILFLTLNGLVYSCGRNSCGQCGFPSPQNILTPQLIPIQNNNKIIAIATGKLHSLFIDTKKRLLVCGYNYCGQLGINNENSIAFDDFDSDNDSDSDSDSDSDNDFIGLIDNLTMYKPIINT
eukprot:428037_1